MAILPQYHEKIKNMVTYYNGKDLESFGQYLLSYERKQHYEFNRENPLKGDALNLRLANVWKEDIENWLEREGNKLREPNPEYYKNPEERTELTYGQKMVGMELGKVEPSAIGVFREKYSEIIDLLYAIYTSNYEGSLIGRSALLALNEAEGACLRAIRTCEIEECKI